MKLRIVEHRGRYTVERQTGWWIFTSWALWSIEYEVGRWGVVEQHPLDFATAEEAKEYISLRKDRMDAIVEHSTKKVVEELEVGLDS